MAVKRGPDNVGDERPRWRDWDEDPDEPRDWEIEPEEEKGDRQPVLGGTAPLARFVFLVIIVTIVLGAAVAFIAGAGGWFGG